MEKTLTININGWVFNINEDAYNLLTEYFKKLKEYFSKQEGGNEIVADIEARVAELFKEKMDEKETVINIKHVEEVMKTLGQPYEMEEDMDAEETHEDERKWHKKSGKKLFRDPDHSHIAGIAGGLGKYLNLDPVFLRIAFLLLIPAGGTGLILYIILWILIPEAASTSDRIRMEGKKVNVENIENKVREEASYLKDRLSDFSEEAIGVYHKTGPARRQSLKNIESIFKTSGKIILRVLKFILGLVLFLNGIGLLIGFAILFFNWIPGLDFDTFFIEGLSLPTFISTYLLDTKYTIITLIAITTLAFIPIVMLVFNGVRFLFNIKRNKLVGTIAFQVWLVALIISLGMSYTTFTAFKKDAINITSHSLGKINSDTLNINVRTDTYYQNIVESDQKTVLTQDDNFPILHDGMFYGKPRIEILVSDKDKFEMKLYTSASGHSEDEALAHIKNTDYIFLIDSTGILLDPYFGIEKESHWRNQDVRIKIFVPEGKYVSIDKRIYKHFRLKYAWRRHLENNKEKASYWTAHDGDFINISDYLKAQDTIQKTDSINITDGMDNLKPELNTDIID